MGPSKFKGPGKIKNTIISALPIPVKLLTMQSADNIPRTGTVLGF